MSKAEHCEPSQNPKELGPEELLPKLNSELWSQAQKPGQLIPLLQSAQEAYGYISEETIAYVSKATGIAEAKVYGVITFYKQFRLHPLGEYLVRVCDGTACHVNGSKDLLDVIYDELKMDGTQDTTPDGKFTVETVACIGCCSLAPVITVNDDTHGRLTPLKLRKVIKRYKRRAAKSDKQKAAAAAASAE
ncbi:MAG: NAD(P)H-dependent oxidoreductase subunit E [Deltaproteobacteria bacterium]|nr:NAD(P)H-dependent oxidoreductase subunit E [Deltaproteobacteria bacterium]